MTMINHVLNATNFKAIGNSIVRSRLKIEMIGLYI